MSEYNENQPASQGIKPWIPLILALIYTVSPIDLVPDFIPIVGWFEDALLVIVGGLNGIQNGVLEANSSLRTLIKYLKWGLLIIGGIAILIVVLLVVLVFKVVSK
ncbi:YkvA family protein [uncultured Brachyspira sp.]|uniref:YkvA family protein n=1 Tax=uncultured Brachyspira sp. TaxID=221953 RepID=UPI00259B9B29|nr:YkvA family protein [uncultured Brachyspira sp.]